jgi:hypothetical protein
METHCPGDVTISRAGASTYPRTGDSIDLERVPAKEEDE